MDQTSTRPQWVTGFERPSGTEIKRINDHYYLYERLSVYDPKNKKKRKKSGKLIGTITPDGLVPKRERLEPGALICIENREYGASMFLYQSSFTMLSRLQECFPQLWKEIFAMAVMRCIEQCPFKRIGYHYSLSSLVKVHS